MPKTTTIIDIEADDHIGENLAFDQAIKYLGDLDNLNGVLISLSKVRSLRSGQILN